MSVYNARDTLRRSIESVLAQGVDAMEFIILDDGSTDGSAAQVEAIRDRRIRLIVGKTNLGLVKRLNQGIAMARGEFIARMDADDECVTGRFQEQLAYLDANEDIAACGTDICVVETGKADRIWRYPRRASDVRAGLLFNNTLAHPTLMVRRAAFESLNPPYRENYERAEDYDMMVRFTAEFDVVNLPIIGLRYCRSTMSHAEMARALGRQNSAKIREKLLRDMGVMASEKDLHFHHQIADGQPVQTRIDLRSVADWFGRLVEANDEKGLFLRDRLREILLDRFAKLARSQATGYLTVVGMLARAEFLSDNLSRVIAILRYSVSSWRRNLSIIGH